MLSYSSIREAAQEAAQEAQEAGKLPASMREFTSRDPLQFIRTIPFLGDYVPEGWEVAGESYMVDSSGLGSEGEPALTIGKFARRLETLKKSGENYGLAIVEAGQFQVVIQEYKPDSRDFTHTGKLTESDFALLPSKR